MECVGSGVVAKLPGFGDAWDNLESITQDIVLDKSFIEESGGPQVMHPAHPLGIEGVDFRRVDKGQISAGFRAIR